jgi:hypothetical protein
LGWALAGVGSCMVNAPIDWAPRFMFVTISQSLTTTFARCRFSLSPALINVLT